MTATATSTPTTAPTIGPTLVEELDLPSVAVVEGGGEAVANVKPSWNEISPIRSPVICVILWTVI